MCFNLASDWLKNQQVNSDWLEHVAKVFSRAWEMHNKSKHNMNVLQRKYMYALLTKRVRSRWLVLAKFYSAFLWAERKSRSIKNAKKNEAMQYPAILTEQAWSIQNLLYVQKENFFLRDRRGKFRAGKIGPSCPLGQPISESQESIRS